MDIKDFNEIHGVDLSEFYKRYDFGDGDPERFSPRIDELQEEMDNLKKTWVGRKRVGKWLKLYDEREVLIRKRADIRLWELYAMEMAAYDYYTSMGIEWKMPKHKGTGI